MVKSLLHTFSRIGFWLFLCGLIALCVLPFNSSPEAKTAMSSSFRADYLLHFIVFFMLTISYFLAYPRHFQYHKKKRLSIVSAGFLIAFSTEIAHYFIPYRTFNPWDLFFNLMGLFSGYSLVILFNHQRKKQTKQT